MRNVLLVAAAMALASGAAAQDDGKGSAPAVLWDNPHPEIERLLHQAAALPYPPAPAAVAGLPATRELLARMVLDERIGRHVMGKYLMVRPPGVVLYSIVLAIQVALYGHGGLHHAIHEDAGEVELRSYLVGLLALDAEPELDYGKRRRVYMQTQDPALYRQALQYHRLRIPLDRALLAALIAKLPASPDSWQASRLRMLLPRLTPGARAWLAAQRGRLTPARRVLLRPPPAPAGPVAVAGGEPAPGPVGQTVPALPLDGAARPAGSWVVLALGAAGVVLALLWVRRRG